ncbi:MAG: hypothetical protein KGZ83_04980 [Sulfuricella sp.]|nr:hypothetical protein [Sulfuricella sp.]
MTAQLKERIVPIPGRWHSIFCGLWIMCDAGERVSIFQLAIALSPESIAPDAKPQHNPAPTCAKSFTGR